MTRKDYILLADALLSARRQANTPEKYEGVMLAQACVADILASGNQRFDRNRFERACMKGSPLKRLPRG